MRFHLVDRILAVSLGRSIQVAKNLTLGEEYLADHFPTFPVMPGVLMLQTLVEAGAWLLRISNDFRHSVIVLREAKNVKYGHFMRPGLCMTATAEVVETNGSLVTLKGRGEAEGNQTVSARLVLEQYNLKDRNPNLRAADERLVAYLRGLHLALRGDLTSSQPSTG